VDNLSAAKIRSLTSSLPRLLPGWSSEAISERSDEGRLRIPDYDLVRRIGAGAYGEVWLARSTATGVFRAAKIVWQRTFEDDRPFQREFEGIQRFEEVSREHPSQLALFHIGRNDAGGYFYYIMELADRVGVQSPESKVQSPAALLRPGAAGEAGVGESYAPHTLRADLARGRLPAARVLEIGMALAEALGHLHGKGLIHRDVKPSNVIFVNGRPKLADIGLVTDASDQCSIVGTEGYLPPEGPGSPQADIFALGKVLYEAATALDRRELPKLPENLRAWPDTLQVFELNEIILKACASQPKERYQTVEEMYADLALLHSGQSVRDRHSLERRLRVTRRVAAGVVAVMVLGVVPYTLAIRGLQRVKAERDLERSESYASDLRLCSQWFLWRRYAQCRHLLLANVPRPGERDLRSFEWWYYWRLCRGDDLAPMGPVPSSLPALGFLSDEQVIAGASQVRAPPPGSLSSYGGGLFVWDWKARRLLRYVEYGGVSDFSISPDGRRLAIATWNNNIRILDAESYAVVTNYVCTNAVTDLAFSPDGRFLAARGEDCLYLHDLKENGPAEVLPAFENHQEKPAFSPDGRLMVFMLPDAHLGLWDVREHRIAARLPNAGQAHLSGENGLKPDDVATGRHAFSPDGKLLASGDCFGRVMIHNLESGAVRLIGEHFDYFAVVAFSPDGKTLASGSWDGLLKLWDPVTSLELATYHGHDKAIESVAFTPNGDFVLTGGRDGYIRVWDAHPASALRDPSAETAMQLNPAMLATQQNTPNLSVPLGRAFSPNGRLLHYPSDPRPPPPSRRDTVQQFDAGTEHAISPDARYLVFRATNGMCRLTDLESGAEIASYTPSPGESIGAVSPNGRWVAASFENGRLVLREPRLAGTRTIPEAHNARVTSIEFSPSGNALATASRDGWLKVWDLRDLRLLAQARMPGETHFEGPKALALSRDGTLVACGENSDARIVILDLARPLRPRELPAAFDGWTTRTVAFSPDGRLLAAGGYSDRALLYDVRSGRQVAPIGNEVYDEFIAAQFTPDGRRLALASSGHITLWDLESKRNVLAICVSGDAIIDQMRINPAGDRIAVAVSDGTCRIYSAVRDE